jgi:hypothetical protein
MAENNEDTLTQVLLTVCKHLREDVYFTPTNGRPAIPVVEDVNQDILKAIQLAENRGILVAVGYDTISFPQSGGCLAASGSVIVRVTEIIPQNRGASGAWDNGLRVAQRAAQALQGKACALREDGTRMTGGIWNPVRIEQQIAVGADGQALPTGRAYHLILEMTNCSLVSFTRRTTPPKPGAA